MNVKKNALQYLKTARLSGLTSLPAAAFSSSPAVTSDDPWKELSDRIHSCVRCSISKNIHNYVVGEGNIAADIMFVGEGPGEQEDLKGKPFIGRAGQLLTAIITKGMRIKREDVYIANILKCRPPGNRNPLPDEIGNCFAYLEQQIEMVSPKVLITLGNIPTQVLLKTETGITRMRGTFGSYKGIPVMPTFHPAYLLRNESKKRDVWEDIQKVMEVVGLPFEK